jgi:hypothetical protein
LENVEYDFGTYKKAWARCREPRLYGWFLGQLASKHDYYRRALMSVISQMLYDFHLKRHEGLLGLTEMLDRFSEGDDGVVKGAKKACIKMIHALDAAYTEVYLTEEGDYINDAIQLVQGAAELMKKRPYPLHFELMLEDAAWGKETKVCALIRKMVERPTIEEIEACG